MTDFGAELREARERKGISLRQIAAATKISVAALEALERDDISKLPGGIFSRAFVRSYATEIGLNPDETIRKFLAQFPTEAAAQTASLSAATEDAHGRSSRESPLQDSEDGEFESKQRMAGVVLRLIAISLPIAGAILYFSVRGNSSTGSGEAGTDNVNPQVRASNVSEPAAPGGPVSAVPASNEALVPAVAATAAPERPAAIPAATGMAIEIAPTADCWVQLTIDGDVAVARVVRAGEREKRDFAREAVLQVGDAAVCEFSLNGRVARPLGGAGQVREARITPVNYTSFLP